MYASSPSNCLYIPRFGSTKDKKCKDACEKYIAAQDFECTATGKTRAANSAQMKAYASIPKFDNMVSAPYGRHYGPVTDVNTVEEFIMGGDANSRQQQSGSRQQQSGSSCSTPVYFSGSRMMLLFEFVVCHVAMYLFK